MDLDPTKVLTERQQEVAALVAKGFTNGEIAGMLDLSAGTVKLHVSAIIERLEVSNRTEAASAWLAHGVAEGLASVALPIGREAGESVQILSLGEDDAAAEQAAEMASALGYFLSERGVDVLDPETIARRAALAVTNATLRARLGVAFAVRVSMAAREGGGDDSAQVLVELAETANDRIWLSRAYDVSPQARARLVVEMGLDVEQALDAQPAGDRQGGGNSDESTDRYWQGCYALSRRSPESLQAALGHFTAAIGLRPDFAEAHVGLANTQCQLAVYAGGMGPHFFASGLKSAAHAVDLAPELASSHAALGYARMFGAWDFDGARQSLERCLRLDPDDNEGLSWMSLWHMFQGDMTEAMRLAEAGLARNPLALAHYLHVGQVLRSAGDQPGAIRTLDRALEMEPGSLRAMIFRALCAADTGDFRSARAFVDRAIAAYPTSGMLVGISGYVSGLSGDEAGAEQALEALGRMAALPVHSPLFEAMVLIGLARLEPAMEKLRAALPGRVPMLLGWRCDPMFLRLADVPGYDAVGAEIGVG